MKCYIYCITNIINGKIYIGSTNNYVKRIRHHKYQLRIGKHHSAKLQYAYNKYGFENFKFELLEEKEINNISEQINLEDEYLKIFECSNKGYNIIPGASVSDKIWTEEEKRKMGEKVSRRHKGKIPKNLESIRCLQRRPILEYENGAFIREYESQREAAKILEISYQDINNCVRGIIRHTKKYPNKYWEYKDAKGIRKIKYNSNSASRKGKFKKVVQKNIISGEQKVFDSSIEAAKFHNCSQTCILHYCKGRVKKPYKNEFSFRYEDLIYGY